MSKQGGYFEGKTSNGLSWTSWRCAEVSFNSKDGLIPLEDRVEAQKACNAAWQKYQEEIIPECMDKAVREYLNFIDLSDLKADINTSSLDDIRANVKNEILAEKAYYTNENPSKFCKLAYFFDEALKQRGIYEEHNRRMALAINFESLYSLAIEKVNTW